MFPSFLPSCSRSWSIHEVTRSRKSRNSFSPANSNLYRLGRTSRGNLGPKVKVASKATCLRGTFLSSTTLERGARFHEEPLSPVAQVGKRGGNCPGSGDKGNSLPFRRRGCKSGRLATSPPPPSSLPLLLSSLVATVFGTGDEDSFFFSRIAATTFWRSLG